MRKLFVEAEIIAIDKRADSHALVFQSDRQAKAFAINLEIGGDLKAEDLKVGDRVIVEVSVKKEPKPKKTKKASSKDSNNVNDSSGTEV